MIGAKRQRAGFTQPHFWQIQRLPLRVQRTGRSGAGFTLIELLIVAAIFSTAALMATTVFSNIQTRQRQIQGQQRVTSDGRYVMESIARSVRTGSINYAIYTNGVYPNVINGLPTNTVSMIDQQNVVTCYKWENSALWVITPATTQCATSSGSAWTQINPTDLRVDSLQFLVTPKSDAFRPVPRASIDCTPLSSFVASSGTCSCSVEADCWSDQTCDTTSGTGFCSNANVQPQVTIVMKTSSANAGPGEQASVELQTTVVSRVYQR